MLVAALMYFCLYSRPALLLQGGRGGGGKQRGGTIDCAGDGFHGLSPLAFFAYFLHFALEFFFFPKYIYTHRS
jgi:hypothetical protein